MINLDADGLLTDLSGAGFETFLTVAVTLLGALTGVVTLRAAVLRVRVLRGVATVIKKIHLNSLIIHPMGWQFRVSLQYETKKSSL